MHVDPELDGDPLSDEACNSMMGSDRRHDKCERVSASSQQSQLVLEELGMAGNPTEAPFVVIKGAELRKAFNDGGSDMTHKHLTGVEAFAVAHHDGKKEIIDAVGADDEVTSDEEEPNVVRPKQGDGRLGVGSPIYLLDAGEKRPFHDGAGLCSPGRWPPKQRVEDPISKMLFGELMGLLWKKGDPMHLACKLAHGGVE